jgi:hypothetical protein
MRKREGDTMSALLELKVAIDAGAMIVEKDTDQRDSIVVYLEDGYYSLLLPAHIINNFSSQGDDINAIFARANWAIGSSFGYVNFEELLTDLGKPAGIDKWRVAAPPFEVDFPEDWPESMIKAYEVLFDLNLFGFSSAYLFVKLS